MSELTSLRSCLMGERIEEDFANVQPALPFMEAEDPAYLREQLITYIGNKRSLLPLIGIGVDTVKRRLKKDKLRCLDLFSGTGIVSRYLKAHSSRLVANDLELYSAVTNTCYLSNPDDDRIREIAKAVANINQDASTNPRPGFIADLYAPDSDADIRRGERAFYTRRNAAFIDTARQLIDQQPSELRPYLIAPLIAKASVHANTSGVFKGFYKTKCGVGQFGGHGKDALSRILRNIELVPPIFSRYSSDVEIVQSDANDYVRSASETFDLAYLDPPYNQHPYGSNYFMLNLIATYVAPTEVSQVSGIPKDWNRSRYNQRAAAQSAILDAVSKCPAKFVMISYNSEGFVSKERFLSELGHLGKVSHLERPYNTFRGSRNLAGRALHVTEYVYLLEKA